MAKRDSFSLTDAKIGIITALPEEYASVCAAFRCGKPIRQPGVGAGRTYVLGKISAHGGGIHVVAVTQLADMGNSNAASHATLLLEHCPNVQHVIMCGIAGGIPCPSKPEHHVRLGDIVVSDKIGVVQYDLVKEEWNETIIRNPPRPPSASLLEVVQRLFAGELGGKRPWETVVNDLIERLGKSRWKRPGQNTDKLHLWNDGVSQPIEHPKQIGRRAGKPKVFKGAIASANVLLKNPAKRDALKDKFGVKAFEMEGSGVADASWIAERGGFLVVRGICDYCDPSKGDTWHFYAAVVAAAFTLALVQELPIEGQPAPILDQRPGSPDRTSKGGNGPQFQEAGSQLAIEAVKLAQGANQLRARNEITATFYAA